MTNATSVSMHLEFKLRRGYVWVEVTARGGQVQEQVEGERGRELQVCGNRESK